MNRVPTTLARATTGRPDTAVERVLAALRPTPLETELLRACLWEDEDGAAAWRRWRRQVSDPVAVLSVERGGLRYLLPLLLTPATRQPQEERELLTLLRAARLRERLRDEVCSRVYGEVRTVLGERELAFLVGGEFAVAATAYSDRSQRHCHELELLLTPGDLVEASRTLVSELHCSPRGPSDADGALVEHPSGLPVRLSTGTLGAPHGRIAVGDLEQAAVLAQIGDSPASVPSAADLLVDVLVRAVADGRSSGLWWVCDGALLCRSAHLDWERVLDHFSGTALMLRALARYLAEEVGASIPALVLERLRLSAARATPSERVAILRNVSTWNPIAVLRHARRSSLRVLAWTFSDRIRRNARHLT